jgi:hypothetical protein
MLMIGSEDAWFPYAAARAAHPPQPSLRLAEGWRLRAVAAPRLIASPDRR